MTKLSILEFLKRTTTTTWSRTYDLILRFVYGFLLITFIAIIIGTLTECQPFPHYWQVVPDPGPQCREGLVQLIIMGVCDIVTDVVLIAFPIPVVLRSSMPLRKKFSMIILFCLSAILIAITAYRIPTTIERRADQPYRSLLASLEILAATGVSNAVIIGSFIRDKGVKKAKFRAASLGDISFTGSNNLQRVGTTRSAVVTMKHWGSDEDLVRDIGVALPTTLHHGSSAKARAPSAAPRYEPSEDQHHHHQRNRSASQFEPHWSFHSNHNQHQSSRSRSRRPRRRSSGSIHSTSTTSTDIKLRDLQSSLDEPVSPGAHTDTEPLSKQMSFFDVGGLVDAPKTQLHQNRQQQRPQLASNSSADSSPSPGPGSASQRGRTGSKAFLSDIGGLLGRHKEEDEEEQEDKAAGEGGLRPGGGGATTSVSRSLTPSRLMERRRASRSPNPVKRLAEAGEEGGPGMERSPVIRAADRDRGKGPDELSFGDVGGLLSR